MLILVARSGVSFGAEVRRLRWNRVVCPPSPRAWSLTQQAAQALRRIELGEDLYFGGLRACTGSVAFRVGCLRHIIAFPVLQPNRRLKGTSSISS